jgi:hypothetical protein
LIEVWKDIPGYEGYYQASNMGKIRSLDRKEFYKDKRCPSKQLFRLRKGQILSCSDNQYGYLYVNLHKNKIKTTHHVARLILITFNRFPKNNEQACHFPDSNKYNNKIDNLRWGTAQENARDRDNHGNTIREEKMFNAKLNKKKVEEILKLLNNNTQTYIANLYNINRKTIFNIKHNLIWKSVPRNNNV